MSYYFFDEFFQTNSSQKGKRSSVSEETNLWRDEIKPKIGNNFENESQKSDVALSTRGLSLEDFKERGYFPTED